MLPRLYIPVSGFVVTPVLGWWRTPSPVGAVDPAETARVFTAPVADLTDPANRVTAVHPSGHAGPAFLVDSALVWGFTAGVIDRILHFAGWEQPWDRTSRSRSTGAHDRLTPGCAVPGLTRAPSNRPGQETNLRGYRR